MTLFIMFPPKGILGGVANQAKRFIFAKVKLALFSYKLRLILALALLTTNLSLYNSSHAFTASNKPPVQLANLFEKQNVSDYLISEKYDGIRAIWRNKQLKTRSGKPIFAPAWFTDSLPDVWLDGELWIERGKFQTLSSIVLKKKPIDTQWKQVKYMVFDAPAVNKPFTERAKTYTQLVSSIAEEHILPVKQFRVENNSQLHVLLEQYTLKGAEGLMLVKSDSMFVDGRSQNLLKLKTYMDAEAVVLAHTQGKGKYKGMLGALIVEYQHPSGQVLRFKIGTGFNDSQRASPPAIGSSITFKYHGFTNDGIPRFASYLRKHDNK